MFLLLERKKKKKKLVIPAQSPFPKEENEVG